MKDSQRKAMWAKNNNQGSKISSSDVIDHKKHLTEYRKKYDKITCQICGSRTDLPYHSHKDSAHSTHDFGVRGRPIAKITRTEYNKLYPLLLGGLPNENELKFLNDLGQKYGYNWKESKIGFLDNDGHLWIEKL